MVRSIVRTVVIMGAWALLHSLLATGASKRFAARLIGEQRRNGLYRIGYNSVAVATTAGALLSIHRLPDRQLYRLQGSARLLARFTQLGLLLVLFAAAVEIGIGPFSGMSELLRHLLDRQTPDAPEAQGPALAADGLRTGGPFRYVRHPLNAGATALIFATPDMSVVRLTIAVVTLVYALLGSRLEERRLLARYGEPYRRYLASGVPFFVPRLSPPGAARYGTVITTLPTC